MNSRQQLLKAVAALAATWSFSLPLIASDQSTAVRPNIVLILADKHPELVDKMGTQWRAWANDVGVNKK